MLIGAHTSISGGYDTALLRVKAMGGNVVQMFSGSPRGWNIANVSPEIAERTLRKTKELEIKKIYFHASYLVNLADPGYIGDRSAESLIAELIVAKKIGAVGSIIHLGSFKNREKDEKPTLFGKPETMREKHPNYKVLIDRIKLVLESTPKETFFIMENAGTRKIGRKMEEFGEILSDISDPRLKVCLDTCHLHVAGYDINGKEKLSGFLKNFDDSIGIERLEVIHANDSRDEFGSLCDRHDNIGEGKVGVGVFKSLLSNPKTKSLPYILEVPGFDDMGPDKKNMDIVKALAKK